MSFFNFDKVEVGTQVSIELIEKFIQEQQSCEEVPHHGVGDFVAFKNCRDIVQNSTMLNMSSDGAEILIREYCEIDIRCTKYNGRWFVTSKFDRRS